MHEKALGQYVARIMYEKKLSGYGVERQSKGGIAQSHVNRIKNGNVTQPSPLKLKALAKGLDVSESEIFAVARGAGPDQEELKQERLQTIDNLYQRLSGKKRKKADFLLGVVEREIKRLSHTR
jgi:transcriptional regulator with XRE-family HTH domain